jgi:diguanylate cyclase (GGDEF)-like protein
MSPSVLRRAYEHVISDPLRAGDPRADVRARERLRVAGALLLAAAALTLGGVLALPDPDPSDHAPLAALAGGCALLAALLAAWRRPPSVVLHAICPLGIVIAAAAMGLAEPVGLTPAYMLWPLTVAAYFFGRREVAANGALVLVASAVVLVLWVDPGLRAATFAAVVSIAGVGAAIVLSLREQVRDLVRKLQVLATSDPLTGALSRVAFDERVAVELERSRRSGRPCAMAVIDVDHFKRLNDRLGHAAGDDALRTLAGIIQEERRVSDVFGRVGGDEFAILVADTDLEGAARLAERLRERMALVAGLRGWPTTLSIGVADGAGTVDEVLRSADEALYAAKRSGRDRVARAARPVPAPKRLLTVR